jgi:uncharacterized protein
MRWVTLITVVAAATIAIAFRADLAGTQAFYLVILAGYGLLGALAAWGLWQSGSLVERLKPKWGDLSIGAITAIALLFASWAARSLLAPGGTPRQAWMMHLYLQLGDTESIQRSSLITTSILLIVLLEELVWRGFVLEQLTERFGPRRGWPLAALLYGLTLVATVFTLADPIAGPNPLLLIGGLGCGIVWSFIAQLTGRLPPVIISHAAFTYFSATQFRWPGM